MNMRTIIFILGLFLFLSCKERTIPQESSCVFQLPQKKIFVKTCKYKGGRFTIFFASDSLLLNESKDSIEFKTGAYPQIIVDKANIYVNSQYGGARIIKKENGEYEFETLNDSIFYNSTMILSIGSNNFNTKVVSDSVFHAFFDNHVQKYPYSFIHIDTKEYNVSVNQQRIKQGDIHGGW
jgi:hypothetical protein